MGNSNKLKLSKRYNIIVYATQFTEKASEDAPKLYKRQQTCLRAINIHISRIVG